MFYTDCVFIFRLIAAHRRWCWFRGETLCCNGCLCLEWNEFKLPFELVGTLESLWQFCTRCATFWKCSWFAFSRPGGALLWCLPRSYLCQEGRSWERNKDKTAPVTAVRSAGSCWMFAITNTFRDPLPFLHLSFLPRLLLWSCCAALTWSHLRFVCKEYLCDGPLSAHTCFPSGRPWWKDSWRAAARPEAFSARPSADVHALRSANSPPVIITHPLFDVCVIRNNSTLMLRFSHVWFSHTPQRHDSLFFSSIVFASFWVIPVFIWGSCTFSQRVCAACSTCLPVMWKGWERIALYIEVYVRGGLALFGLDCARGAY